MTKTAMFLRFPDFQIVPNCANHIPYCVQTLVFRAGFLLMFQEDSNRCEFTALPLANRGDAVGVSPRQ